nr:hypothetical protein [uncultured Dysosmobacter sp.]
MELDGAAMYSVVETLSKNGALQEFCAAHNVEIKCSFDALNLIFEVRMLRGHDPAPLQVRRRFAFSQLYGEHADPVAFMDKLEEMAAEFDD